MRCCVNSAGPGESSLISAPTISSSGAEQRQRRQRRDRVGDPLHREIGVVRVVRGQHVLGEMADVEPPRQHLLRLRHMIHRHAGEHATGEELFPGAGNVGAQVDDDAVARRRQSRRRAEHLPLRAGLRHQRQRVADRQQRELAPPRALGDPHNAGEPENGEHEAEEHRPWIEAPAEQRQHAEHHSEAAGQDRRRAAAAWSRGEAGDALDT